MKRVYNAQKQELIAKLALELKEIKEITAPSWADFVKTGGDKARPPTRKGWWNTRAASVLLRISETGPIGVSKLRVKYGGKKRRGHQPPEFRQASGNIIRKILQQLEKSGLVKQAVVSGHKGRAITPKGVSTINAAAKKTEKKLSLTKKKESAHQKSGELQE